MTSQFFSGSSTEDQGFVDLADFSYWEWFLGRPVVWDRLGLSDLSVRWIRSSIGWGLAIFGHVSWSSAIHAEIISSASIFLLLRKRTSLFRGKFADGGYSSFRGQVLIFLDL